MVYKKRELFIHKRNEKNCMKKIDLLMFNDELDILEARLKYLYEYMDYFIITESDHTFSGSRKEFNFEKNSSRFKKFKDKIIYQKLSFSELIKRLEFSKPFYTDFSVSYPHKHGGRLPKTLHQSLKNEIIQRDSCVDGLLQYAAADDMIFISDVDEFPSIQFLENIKNISYGKTYILEQDWRQFYLNYQVESPWYGTVVTNMNEISKHSIDLLRCATSKKQDVIHEIIKNAGWHLSYMGGAKAVKKKLNDLSYQGIRAEITKLLSNISEKYLENRLRRGEDILNQNKAYRTVGFNNFPIDVFKLEFIKNNVFK